jgi:ribosomal protein L37AE/L43A
MPMTIRSADRARSVQSDHLIDCAQCGHPLAMPEWSEQTSPRSVRHLWSCTACDYQFETTLYFAEQQAA